MNEMGKITMFTEAIDKGHAAATLQDDTNCCRCSSPNFRRASNGSTR
jgi:hypothetical protein